MHLPGRNAVDLDGTVTRHLLSQYFLRGLSHKDCRAAVNQEVVTSSRSCMPEKRSIQDHRRRHYKIVGSGNIGNSSLPTSATGTPAKPTSSPSRGFLNGANTVSSRSKRFNPSMSPATSAARRSFCGDDIPCAGGADIPADGRCVGRGGTWTAQITPDSSGNNGAASWIPPDRVGNDPFEEIRIEPCAWKIGVPIAEGNRRGRFRNFCRVLTASPPMALSGSAHGSPGSVAPPMTAENGSVSRRP